MNIFFMGEELGSPELLQESNIVVAEQYLDKGVMLIGVLTLGIMGALASYAGGVSIWRGSVRVMIWGIVAMLFSAWIGSLFNVAVT